MKRDLEQDLRRGARALERDVPARVLTALHARLAHEPVAGPDERAANSGELTAASSELTARRPRARRVLVLAAATILIAALLSWTYQAFSSRAIDPAPWSAPRSVVAVATPSGSSVPSAAFVRTLPTQGLALATLASSSLTREWEGLKRDSQSIVRGLWNRVPPLTLRAN